MFCSKCGKANSEGERFCRSCGTGLPELSLTTVERSMERHQRADDAISTKAAKDPDELTGKGVGSVIIGDGFLMVAVILAASNSAVSSMLWLFLLIPAFFFFGKGFADVLHAKQIRRRQKQNERKSASSTVELPPGRPSAIEAFEKVVSGELLPIPSVTERTTRNLK